MEKLGNTLKNSSMVTPLNAEPGKSDPGPPILNSPLMKPSDPTGYLDDPTKGSGRVSSGKGKKGSQTGS